MVKYSFSAEEIIRLLVEVNLIPKGNYKFRTTSDLDEAFQAILVGDNKDNGKKDEEKD